MAQSAQITEKEYFDHLPLLPIVPSWSIGIAQIIKTHLIIQQRT
jgi:hypothetical protein